jgi:hypothetical protein
MLMSNQHSAASVVTTQVTVVESEACHFCEDARRVLADLAAAYPLTIETVDVRTPAGTNLMQEHRASMSPLVLVDGVFFSHGRLPRRKLLKLLTGRYGGTDSGRGLVTSVTAGGRRG